jgi:transcriptional regulator
MYIPEYFKYKNLSDVRDFITAYGFAILISQVDGKPWATHIPLMLDKNDNGKDILTGHISKANKQWKEFDNKEVMAIFTGPHTYISSSWYDHENVPTWNYIAVHVYGKILTIEGDLLKKQLIKLVDKYESGSDNPVSVNKMSEGFVEKMMSGIVGFEIEITEIQAAIKLSQNRDVKNYESIINKLEQKEDMNSLEIARLMKNHRIPD